MPKPQHSRQHRRLRRRSACRECWARSLGITALVFLLILALPFLCILLVLKLLITAASFLVAVLFQPIFSLFVRHLYVLRFGYLHALLLRRKKSGHSRSNRFDVVGSTGHLLHVHAIPCLSDNYAYIIVDMGPSGETANSNTTNSPMPAAIVDASDGRAILDALFKLEATHYNGRHIDVQAVLTTHHHWDHQGGNRAVVARYGRDVRVYGSGKDRVDCLTHTVDEGGVIRIGEGMQFEALETPCHTRGSLVFRLKCWGSFECLFTGDTLFLGGCGSLFEGTREAMVRNFWRILRECNPDALVFPGHEYTFRILSELMASSGCPTAPSEFFALCSALLRARQLRSMHPPAPTVPYALREETRYNPNFRPLKDLAVAVRRCWACLYAEALANRRQQQQQQEDRPPVAAEEDFMMASSPMMAPKRSSATSQFWLAPVHDDPTTTSQEQQRQPLPHPCVEPPSQQDDDPPPSAPAAPGGGSSSPPPVHDLDARSLPPPTGRRAARFRDRNRLGDGGAGGGVTSFGSTPAHEFVAAIDRAAAMIGAQTTATTTTVRQCRTLPPEGGGAPGAPAQSDATSAVTVISEPLGGQQQQQQQQREGSSVATDHVPLLVSSCASPFIVVWYEDLKALELSLHAAKFDIHFLETATARIQSLFDPRCLDKHAFIPPHRVGGAGGYSPSHDAAALPRKKRHRHTTSPSLLAAMLMLIVKPDSTTGSCYDTDHEDGGRRWRRVMCCCCQGSEHRENPPQVQRSDFLFLLTRVGRRPFPQPVAESCWQYLAAAFTKMDPSDAEACRAEQALPVDFIALTLASTSDHRHHGRSHHQDEEDNEEHQGTAPS